ncbi:hypothetical protein CHISP_1266 [Chitinispirillum alkaliphilum]|nr:hypothetical protein CHISP_1266 [Chitinispirillum alkaliphilum]
MNRKAFLASVLTFLVLAAVSTPARSIIERKMWYGTVENTTGEARFWTLYLGFHEVDLDRRFPGEGEVTVKTSMDVQIMSSGYVAGSGYSRLGRVDCYPHMMIVNENGEKRITLDSIDYIYDFGSKVTLHSGEKGKFMLNAEGTLLEPNRFILRKFKLREYYGEEILTNTAEEVFVHSISFSREGINRAMKEPLE